MPTYVAFLRAINLGSTRKFPKADIVAAVESTGATGVATYINTGNVLLTTSLRSRSKVEATLERAFEADRGFAVPTIAFSPEEICAIVDDADELAAARETEGRHYVSLLKESPTEEGVRTIEAASPVATYTAAEQAADFGVLPVAFDFTVSQLSPVFGAGHTGAGAFHA